MEDPEFQNFSWENILNLDELFIHKIKVSFELISLIALQM